MFQKFLCINNYKLISPIPITQKRWKTGKTMKIQKFYERQSSVRINAKLFPKARYGGSNTVTLIHGSNRASTESTEYLKEILHKVNAPIIFESINPHPDVECVEDDTDEHENDQKLSSMDELILSFQRNRIALLTDYRKLDILPQNDRIRMSGTLRLFAAVMKFFPFPGFNIKGIDCDITLIGGNVMSDYTGLEYEPIKGMIETLRICNAPAIKKFIEFTYNYAVEHRHRVITFVHKLDHFELSEGLFIKTAIALNTKYPDIRIETITINDLALHVVKNPRRFDLICCNERYTNSLASVISAVCGGVDLFCCSSFGNNYGLFQPLENRLSLELDNNAEEMAPYGVISACVQLLLHMGLCASGTAVWNALVKTMIRDKIKTKNYCGDSSAADVYCKVLDYLSGFKVVS